MPATAPHRPSGDMSVDAGWTGPGIARATPWLRAVPAIARAARQCASQRSGSRASCFSIAIAAVGLVSASERACSRNS
jgi:hypothetical protein